MERHFRPLAPWVIETNKSWWATKSKEYPFHAEAPTSVRPKVVDEALGVDIVSVPLRTGWRTYGFPTEAKRDQFCIQFGGFVLSPYTVCGEETTLACSDCAIDSGGVNRVHVCSKPECRDRHEAEHHAKTV